MSDIKHGAVEFRSGWLVLPVSSSTGGVQSTRRTIQHPTPIGPCGEGEESAWQVTKKIDNVAMVKKVDKTAKAVNHVLRKYCADTSLGYVANDAETLAKVKEEIAVLQKRAEEVNQEAASVGCARRAYVAIVPIEITLATEDAAREVARTIQGELDTLHALLRAGEVGGKLSNHLRLKINNLPNLTVGICAEAIMFAIDEAKVARKEIRAKIKAGQTPESAGAQQELPMIEAAAAMFMPLASQMPDEKEATTEDADEVLVPSLAAI